MTTLDLTGALANEMAGATQLADDNYTLRRALADLIEHGALDLVGDPTIRDRYRKLGTLHESERALVRGLDGSALAASKWNPAQSAAVSNAIREAASVASGRAVLSHLDPATHGHPEQRDGRGLRPGEFTTEDVWALIPDVPITKGIASKMGAAQRAGIIAHTGRHVYRDKGDRTKAHGQKLAVWRAL